MFGFLNIYKPKGKTSHDVVAILRRTTGVKQIGHTGTLDPFAEGVLPICIGKATRLIEYLNDDKAYIGTVQLGSSTTTYDTEGGAVNISDKTPYLEEVEDCLKTFRGEIEQIPPIYSAIKVKGKKLYEYARSGQDVDIEPRKVNIFKLEILNYDLKNKQLELEIECSKGTYIRSIANDLGKKLGCYGHLIKLVRTRAGKFNIENSVKLDTLASIADVERNLIYPLNYLDYQKYEINDNEKKLISNGIKIQTNLIDGISIMVHNNRIVSIGKTKTGIFKPEKVFI